MNKFAIATTMAASALAALIGLAAPSDAATPVAPASAVIDHLIPTNLWHVGGLDDIGVLGPRAHAPQVDNSVHTSPPIVIRHDVKGDISHFSG
jgi:hypothetical protein